MGWEKRYGAGPYYIRKRKVQGQVIRAYFGRGPKAELAAAADDHQRAVAAAQHALQLHLDTLDTQVNAWSQVMDNFTRASLLLAGYRQHHRSEWRQRADCPSTPHARANGADESHTLHAHWLAEPDALDKKEHHMSDLDTSHPLTTSLQSLVQRGITGDRSVLPALRELLTTRPELWTHLQTLGSQVERAWIQVLAGEDLVAQEVLAQQLEAFKGELGGLSPTPLEQLLVERIAVCYLQVNQAELWAVQMLPKRAPGQESWVQQRQDRAQARLLAAIKALAQVRKLLRPVATVQISIAQQHVNDV